MMRFHYPFFRGFYSKKIKISENPSKTNYHNYKFSKDITTILTPIKIIQQLLKHYLHNCLQIVMGHLNSPNFFSKNKCQINL